MEKKVKIYDLHDQKQYKDESDYWKNKSPKEKLHALETIRETWQKLNQGTDENQRRLQRVFQIIERS